MINFYFGIQQAHHKPDIFGVPASLLIESVKVLPQVILHWRERTDIAKANNREPHKVRHSIRWRDDYSSKASVDLLRGKVERAFVEPLHFFDSGREK